MNRYLNFLKSIAFLLGFSALLFYYFDASLLLISVMFLWGLTAGIGSKLFLGYFVPSGMLFRARFILYGLGSGILIGVLMELKHIIEDQMFNWPELVQMLVISIPIGLVGGVWFFSQFKKLKKEVSDKYYIKSILCDSATFIDSENKSHKGLLLLTETNLSFYSKVNNKCLFDSLCSDLNPEIKSDKFLSIPEGFHLRVNEAGSVRVAFPMYWLKIMGMDRTKVIQHQYS